MKNYEKINKKFNAFNKDNNFNTLDNKELQKLIFEKYPEFINLDDIKTIDLINKRMREKREKGEAVNLIQILKDEKIMIPSIAFGFEIGKGWNNLFMFMLKEYKELITQGYAKGLDIVSVKEKWGMLRISLGITINQDNKTGTDNLYEISHFGEIRSKEICENCGKKGEEVFSASGYETYTLCKGCI